MKVYVVSEEGNTDYQFSVVGAFSTQALAERAVRDWQDTDLADGKNVYGREDDWEGKDADEADWEVEYKITEVELQRGFPVAPEQRR